MLWYDGCFCISISCLKGVQRIYKDYLFYSDFTVGGNTGEKGETDLLLSGNKHPLLILLSSVHSSNCCRLPSKVVFRQRSSSLKGRLPSKVIFRQSSSSVKVRLPTKVVFHQRLSSVKGHLPSKFIFRQRIFNFILFILIWFHFSNLI